MAASLSGVELHMSHCPIQFEKLILNPVSLKFPHKFYLVFMNDKVDEKCIGVAVDVQNEDPGLFLPASNCGNRSH